MNLGCGSCGRDNTPGAIFCVYCGAELGMLAEEPPAAGKPRLPEFPTPATPDQLTAAPADMVSVWQQLLFGLAALLVVGLAWFGAQFTFGPSPVALLFGAVFGAVFGGGFAIAAMRPPHGNLRRLLVALGCLVILVAVVVLIGAL